ncbi:hypothetical protein JYT74_03360 [Crocinitomix catalasitica]|nr:hypothetical protein [Crocinitomix catalasitica]
MKYLLITVLLCTSSLGHSQMTLNDISDKSVVWLGIDFSLGKFIGKSGFTDLQKIKDHYFSEWNSLTAKETRDYIAKSIKKKEIAIFLDPVLKNNGKIKMPTYVQDSTHRFSEDEVKATVANYSLPSVEQEIGLVFFCRIFQQAD